MAAGGSEDGMKIELHIERLTLDGIASGPSQGGRVAAAVKRELERLLRNGGIAANLAGGAALPKIAVPEIRVSRSERPDRIGKRIAQSLHKGIGARALNPGGERA